MNSGSIRREATSTASASLEDAAREVTRFLHRDADVMATTGEVRKEARRYARRTMAGRNLAVVMLDRSNLDSTRESTARIVRANGKPGRR